MQPSYTASPIFHAIHQTINRALPHFSKRLPMTRRPAWSRPKEANPVFVESRDFGIEDWDTLFTAVKARLTLAAQAQEPAGKQPNHTQAGDIQPGDTQPAVADAAQVARLGIAVLECVAALDQLHMTALEALAMAHRRGR